MSGTHAGAVKNDYYVWDWGKNDKGQLGNASNQDSDEPVHAGDGSSKALVLNQYRVYTVSPDTECLYGEEATESGRREAPARQDLGLNEVLEFDLNDITNNHFNGFNLHSDGEVIDSNVNDFTIVAADNSIVKVEINESTGSRLVSLKPQGKLGATSVTIIYENQRDKLTNTKVMPVVVRHFDSYDEKVKVCSNCGKEALESEFNLGASEECPACTSRNLYEIKAISAIPKVSAGKNHTVALTTTGEVWAWGEGTYGELGDMEFVQKDAYGVRSDKRFENGPVQLKLYKSSENPPVRDDSIYSLNGIGQKITFTDVAAGDGFTLALDNFGNVWSWGKNDVGQLGRKSYQNSNAGGTFKNDLDIDHVPARVLMYNNRDDSGAWLGNEILNKSYEGNANTFDERDRVIAIAAGKDFGMALTKSGYVYSWGNDKFTYPDPADETGVHLLHASGKLGQGDATLANDNDRSFIALKVNKGNSPNSTGSTLSDVVEIAAGGSSSYSEQWDPLGLGRKCGRPAGHLQPGAFRQ
jgi:alpha-tubulin suppressor-like RCC1 family protein